MKYALNLASDGRVLSVTFDKYASTGSTIVEDIPDGNISDFRYVNNIFIYDPVVVVTEKEEPSQLDIIEAQITYTAMMTGTLLEV